MDGSSVLFRIFSIPTFVDGRTAGRLKTSRVMTKSRSRANLVTKSGSGTLLGSVVHTDLDL